MYQKMQIGLDGWTMKHIKINVWTSGLVWEYHAQGFWGRGLSGNAIQSMSLTCCKPQADDTQQEHSRKSSTHVASL